ncbi:MAG: UbiH/UbiF/VisC/COQ6 family ubiquinone biosynthesis hydroxylase [Woeseia sp.]
MNKTHDIVIAGAGVVGLAIAALLARSPHGERLRITLIDAGQPATLAVDDPTGLRVSALSVGSLGLLQSVGVTADMIAGRACPYRDMRVWDQSGSAEGAAALHFSAAEFALPELGFIVEDLLMRQCLQQLLAESKVDVRYGARIEAVVPNDRGHAIVFDDGNELSADLLVGADGGGSAVRRLSGIEVTGWQYPQAALVTNVRCERPHQFTAWQRFMNDGPIALLPLRDGRVSIVWSTDPDRARELAAADPQTLSRQLTTASDGVLGELQVDAPCGSFPLQAQHAKEYVRRGLVLTGDAAHTVHPLAGQGANLGLADAAALATVISTALGNGEYPGDLPVLRRYERARRGANGTMLRFIDAISRLFRTEAGWLSAARAGGMQAFNRSPLLKRQAMSVALGLDTLQSGEQR